MFLVLQEVLYLERELTAQTLSLKRLKQQFVRDCSQSFPPLTIEQHALASYDQLFEPSSISHDSPESLPESQSAYSHPLGIYRTPSATGAMVLLQIFINIMRAGIDSTPRSPTEMMTVAAVDRLVHYAVILEIKSDSYRRLVATTRVQAT